MHDLSLQLYDSVEEQGKAIVRLETAFIDFKETMISRFDKIDKVFEDHNKKIDKIDDWKTGINCITKYSMYLFGGLIGIAGIIVLL